MAIINNPSRIGEGSDYASVVAPGIEDWYEVAHFEAYSFALTALWELGERLPLVGSIGVIEPDYRQVHNELVARHVEAGWSHLRPQTAPLTELTRDELYAQCRERLSELAPYLTAFNVGLLVADLDAVWAFDEATEGLGSAARPEGYVREKWLNPFREWR
ncbi:MAG: hypothetical protein FWD83_07020 [Promicromonosporaceae bacterium]|nr:hypothetical protein [Promicromonosporaceae bacterium]